MPRWLWVAIGTASTIRSMSFGVEALVGEAGAGAVLDQALGAGAGGHALGLDAGEGAGAALGRDGGAEEGVELLGGQARDGGRDGLGVAGRDPHLGAEAALALADALGDVGGQTLGAERLAEDDRVDGLVDDLLEAGHVDAGLLGIEIHEALEIRVVERLVPRCAAVLGSADPDDLLDADDADAGEADPGGGCLRLRVAGGGRDDFGWVCHRVKYAGAGSVAWGSSQYLVGVPGQSSIYSRALDRPP